MKNIVKYSNYKEYLKNIIMKGERGVVKTLANAAGCQRSYLSQALSSHVNLTADHLCGIAHYLNLNKSETQYLLLLLEKEKAASPRYREHISRQLNVLKEKSARLSKRIKKDDSKEVREKYYSAWFYSALHIATSIDHLNTEGDFAVYLGLGKITVGKVLRELESWDLVANKEGKWVYKSNSKSTFLSNKSMMSRVNHLNWRTQALSRPLQPNRDVHYTSVFSVSKKDIDVLRESVLQFIEEQVKVIGQSGTEELVSFCCDFFTVNTKL